MSALADAKRAVVPGTEWDVTNHYLTRQDHPCYGTHRRRVVRITGSRWYYRGQDRERPEAGVDWPKASQVQVDGDGTIRLYGGGIRQKPDELFLTLVPVR